MKQHYLQKERNPHSKQVSNKITGASNYSHKPSSTSHSITNLIKDCTGYALFLLLIGIAGGIERNTISFIHGSIICVACLSGLGLLARSVSYDN